MEIKDVINNVKIYDLEESIIASGYPMRTKDIIHEITEKDIKRGETLVLATKTGNGAHNQFLTGIRVNFDLTFTNKAWVEAERYRFLEFVSSQSTMHRITSFNFKEQCNQYVDPRIIDIIQQKINEYNRLRLLPPVNDLKAMQDRSNLMNELYLEILYSNPAGFKITARMTTNYRCLRNIYIQRKDHRLPEWRVFCQWIESLPYADKFLIN